MLLAVLRRMLELIGEPSARSASSVHRKLRKPLPPGGALSLGPIVGHNATVELDRSPAILYPWRPQPRVSSVLFPVFALFTAPRFLP
jgi:hypothetical protein